LSDDEIDHFQKILHALAETVRLVEKTDEEESMLLAAAPDTR